MLKFSGGFLLANNSLKKSTTTICSPKGIVINHSVIHNTVQLICNEIHWQLFVLLNFLDVVYYLLWPYRLLVKL